MMTIFFTVKMVFEESSIHMIDAKLDEMCDWCKENIGPATYGDWRVSGSTSLHKHMMVTRGKFTFSFSDSTKCMMFKMLFGGESL